MTSFLSAGVYTREVDFSIYAGNLSTTSFGCVGYANKGPINQPQFISNPVQFSTVFGDPNTSFYGPYAALQYLSEGRQLWYVRVAEPEDDQAQIDLGYTYKSRPASITLKEAATKAVLTGSKINIVTLTALTNKLEFKVDGSSTTLVVTLSLGTSTSISRSISEIAVALNADNNFAAYFVASLSPTGALTIERNVAGSNHGFTVTSPSGETGLYAIMGFNAPQTVWGTGSIDEKAYVMANKVYASFEAADPLLNKIHFILDGAPVDSDGPGSGITLTDTTYNTAEILVAALNSNSTFNADLVASIVNGGIFVSIKSDSDKKFLMLGTDVAASADAGLTIFGDVNTSKVLTGSASATLAITTANNVLSFTIAEATNPAAMTSETYTITIPPATYGTTQLLADAINAALAVAIKTSNGNTVDLTNVAGTEDVITATISGPKLIMTYSNGAAEYVIYDISSIAFIPLFGSHPNQKWTSTVANDVLSVTALSDGTWGNRVAIKIANVDVVNGTFDLAVYERGYLTEKFEKLVKTPELLPDGTVNPKFVETAINSTSQRIVVVNGVGSGEGLLPKQDAGSSLSYLAGGNDGASSVENPSTFIGVSSAVASTGLQLFRNPEQLDINLIAIPGASSAAVINAMIDLCTFRKDCMCLVDPPFSKNTPQAVTNWKNGVGEDHAAFNTSFGAMYWPWLQIYDPVNRTTVWTPPSGHLAFVYAYTDYNAETWSAPAGLTRGRLVTPIKAQYIPTLGDRDLLYSNGINPIATFVREGITVWGQKTLQASTTALDRVSVRRLMLYLEKIVATSVRTLNFEPTDPMTWIQFTNLVEPFLDSVKSRRGIIEYKVTCDATTNTADVQDRNEMYARIWIRPTKTAEFIAVDFILTDSGTAFTELTF